MRIGFALRAKEEYGFGRYLRLLLAALSRADASNEFVIFAVGDAAESAGPLPPRARIVFLPPMNPGFRWRQNVLAPAAKREGIDVFHFHNNTIWSRNPLPTVVTLHHMLYACAREKAAAKWIERAFIGRLMKKIAKGADIVLTVSQSSARDITKMLGIGAPNLRVAHLGADPAFGAPGADAVARVKKAHRLDKPYFFFAGSLALRKNVPGMVRAFRRFNARHGGEYEFVLAGDIPNAIGFPAIEIEDLRRVARPLGFVPGEDLPALYAGATALAYVTYYEGFGLPILEAFACGCPAIVSTTGSCPEIAGDAALLADPENEDAIAGAMDRVADDAAFRSSLIAKGAKRLADFSWDSTARETLKAYRDAIAAH